jgi:hypothetical protein
MNAMRLTVDINGEGWTEDTFNVFRSRVQLLIEENRLGRAIIDEIFPRGEPMMPRGMPSVGIAAVVKEAPVTCNRCGFTQSEHRARMLRKHLVLSCPIADFDNNPRTWLPKQ